jgi:glycosyltransferase involved in cell wall biosynthesis
MSKNITDIKNELSSGLLDGVTLFRFAHMWRNTNSGGVEAYLQNLNRLLLEKNSMRILQMYLIEGDGPFDIEIQKVGKGEIIWVPSIIDKNSTGTLSRIPHLSAIFRGFLKPPPSISHDLLLSTLNKNKPDLAVFHWISEDSKLILQYLDKRNIPFVVVNHFDNKRLNRHYIKKQISNSLAIGGVSNVDVPRFLKDQFFNLSDGVDTDFFQLGKAFAISKKIKTPFIFLPSRITEGKGHIDAIKGLHWLTRNGVSAALVFAGRLESHSFKEKLSRIALDQGLKERVIFAGELKPEDLRNWYAASDVVILPSQSEGLPKVLLEAQSMEKPVVAYDAGGVAEAMQNEVTGFLVKKNDYESLAHQLKQLLENNKKRHQMGGYGRKFVIKRFSLQSLVIRHEDFCLRMLGK